MYATCRAGSGQVSGGREGEGRGRKKGTEGGMKGRQGHGGLCDVRSTCSAGWGTARAPMWSGTPHSQRPSSDLPLR